MSCKQTYFYLENGKDPVQMEFDSDSAAYIKAYEKFTISKSVYNQMKEKGYPVTEPISFSLLNSKKEDITYKVDFYSKESIQSETKAGIDKLQPLSIKPISDVLNDTTGSYLSPIKVISAKYVEKEYSNYKDVRLSYKNISKKKIAAIRFKWVGINAFGEKAEGLSDGGFDDDGIDVNETTSNVWGISSKDGKKITLAYAYEVAFSDGTKWELNKSK